MSASGTMRRNATRQLRTLLENFPAVHMRFYVWRARRHGYAVSELHRSSQLAVVGYEGSGNTFFRVAFNRVNPDAELASHVHTAGLAAAATRLRVPLLILVRDPADAVASKLARFAEAPSIEWALADYARLYERCRRYIDDSVVATFEAATTRPGAITAAVNERFGVSLAVFADDDEHEVAAALEHMQQHSVETFGAEAALRGSAPSEERAAAKKVLLAEIGAPKNARALQRCRTAAEPFFKAAAAAGL